MDSFALTKQDTAMMKGIAICAMLCHHLYSCPEALCEGITPYTGMHAWLGVLGKVCVALFLFCSGYGLTAQYETKSIKEDIKFVAKRLTKFYINYWVIFLIFVPISIFVFPRSLSDAYGENANTLVCLIKDILGVQGFKSYNVTWWFNQLIIFLYLLFPMLYRIIRFKPWLAILAGIALVRVSSKIPYNPVGIWLWQLPFVIGISWKLYEDKLPRVSTWLSEHKGVFAISSLSLLIIAVIVRMFPIIPHWSGVRVDGFVACAVALCIVSLIRYIHYMQEVLVFLGKHSMNIYMTHTFINGYWCLEWLHGCEGMRGGVISLFSH